MTYEKHLYLILYPNVSLVASQYGPKEFSEHYHIGSTRYYTGKLIFAEIDIDFRNDYFEIEAGLEHLVPHEDGTPKATKFIKCYRVLEHMDLDSIKMLYLTTSDSEILAMAPSPIGELKDEDDIRVAAEICPLSMVLLTHMSPKDFGKYITSPANPKGAPTLFYTYLDLDVDGFIRDFEANPFIQAPFSFVHPSKLRDAIFEIRAKRGKTTKGLTLQTPLASIKYKSIQYGFFFATADKELFFPMPSMHELETSNYKFWKSI